MMVNSVRLFDRSAVRLFRDRGDAEQPDRRTAERFWAPQYDACEPL